MIEKIVTYFIFALLGSTVIFLGGLFIHKSKLLAEGHYEAALTGSKPTKYTVWSLLFQGTLFLCIALVSVVFAFKNLVALFGAVICGGKAYWDFRYGIDLLRKARKGSSLDSEQVEKTEGSDK